MIDYTTSKTGITARILSQTTGIIHAEGYGQTIASAKFWAIQDILKNPNADPDAVNLANFHKREN